MNHSNLSKADELVMGRSNGKIKSLSMTFLMFKSIYSSPTLFSIALALLHILPQASLRAETEPAPHLFILSGQSNMTKELGEAFQNTVEQALGKERVVVTVSGSPGQPIKMWDKGWKPPEGMKDNNPSRNGMLYKRMMDPIKKVLGDRKPASVTFIWMQGEADAGRSWSGVYEKSFNVILDKIKADLDIKNINFVVGRINEYYLRGPHGKQMRDLLVKIGDEYPNGAWINTDDLNHGVNGAGDFSFNDGHFPDSGYVVMAQRFVKKACLLLDPNIKLDPKIFKETFIDSHEGFASHQGIGKVVTSKNQPVSKTTSEPSFSILTDGQYGPADHTDKAWIGFAPSEKTIELNIDLGKPMVIDQLGVNMLISSKAKAEFPNTLAYYTSEDGKEFKVNSKRYKAIKFQNRNVLKIMRKKGIAPQSIPLLVGQKSAKARYLKIEIETGDQWVWIDEIVVNPQN